jgi:prepilin-type N-terminal cleavage/methylation domain-containing protein
MQRVHAEAREGGFTLIELVVVLTISSFAFLALATMLGGSMKALSVGKTRSQANELATQGIEDLQRLEFNDLGVCTGAADPAPPLPASLSGLTSVQLPNCTAGTVIYEQPCTPPSGTLATLAVPKQRYSCVKNNVTYTVDRYIMWADAAHTGKRLAVLVSWTDGVGGHQVAQESSLRSPEAASVIGIQPPQLVSVSVNAPNPATIQADGTLSSTLTFSATTTGITASDKVYVTLDTLVTQPDGTVAAIPTQFPLTTANGTNWTTALPNGTPPIFGAGRQFATFTTVRSSSDGKANSRVASTTLSFCPGTGCPPNMPSIASASASPLAIDIGSGGVLQSTFTLSASTTNLTTESTVSAIIQTQTGAATLQLKPSTACVAGGSCNSWASTFAPGSVNFRFLPGSQQFHITATAPVAGAGGTNGSSAVGTTNGVVFG